MNIFTFAYLFGDAVAVPAGVFSLDVDRRIGNWEYGTRYARRPNALSVDPIDLPLGLSTYPAATLHEGLYGAFRDALPDYWGRMVLARAKNVFPETLTTEDLLLCGNSTRVGNLDFRISRDAPEPPMQAPNFSELPALMEVANNIEHGQPLSTEQEKLMPLLVQGSSLGGARPKSTVQLDGALWLAKFPSRGDAWNYARVEWATMTMASRCGIRVPEMRVEHVDGFGDVFLIQRFDRGALEGQAAFERYGYISALTAMGVDEGDRLRHSYLGVADAMRRHGLADAAQIKELFCRMAFNILVRNSDDHARNHGFLHLTDEWSLSPAFDITPTRKIPGVGAEFHLAMQVGTSGTLASWENALSRVERFGYDREEAINKIHEMCEVVAKWREIFQECEVSEDEMDTFSATFEDDDSPLGQGQHLDCSTEPLQENHPRLG